MISSISFLVFTSVPLKLKIISPAVNPALYAGLSLKVFLVISRPESVSFTEAPK